MEPCEGPGNAPAAVQGLAGTADYDDGDESMLGAIGSALNGVAAGFDRLDRAAARIAKDGDGEAVAGNMIDLMRARNEVRTNLAVVKSADELTGTILDLFA